MRPVSNAFQRYLYENNRSYLNRVEITLSDDTPLTIDNTRLWAGGVQIDDNVSDQSSFTSLGSAIINSLQIIINNIYDEYSIYIFEGAKVVPYIGLLIGTSVEEIKLGEFTVNSATYNGALITLDCLDNMAKFDKPYSSSTLIYPATLQQIVSDACTNCGVLLESTTFSNYTFSVATRPTDEALTYREVIAYAATLAGCFAKCNSKGKLELNWFDIAAIQAFSDGIDGGIFDADTPYSTGDSVDGGVFNPWETGDIADGGTFSEFPDLHFLTSLKSQEIGIDDIVITGIQIQLKIEGGTSADIETSLFGNEGYLIKIENNPFITVDNVQAVGTYLENKIVGLTFRNATVSHLNDPSIEAGDVAIIRDRKNNLYPILITNTEFIVDSYQRTISAAEPPLRHEAVRFNQATKSFVESKEMVKNEANLREQLQTDLTQALNAKPGMYETRIQEAGGGYTYYLHDKPNLSDSAAVIKITNEAVGITANYQAQSPTWYGLTVDGNFIANIMSVIGIDFDWGTGGTLVLGGNNNVNGSLTINNAQGQPIGYWTNTGITANAGKIGGLNITADGLDSTSDITVGTASTQYQVYLRKQTSSTSYALAALEREYDGSTYGNWTYNFYVRYDGYMSATKGAIGPWTIGSTGIYNGKTEFIPGTNGTYIGTDGIFGETAQGYYWITPSGSLELREKASSTVPHIGIYNTDGSKYFHAGYDFLALYKDNRANTAIWMNIYNDAGSGSSTYDPHILIGADTFEPKVYVGHDNGWSGVRVNGKDYNGGSANEVGLELWGGSEGAQIVFESLKDQALIANYYNNTKYNLIRNHNNGNISISASGSGLYLGYENTTSLNLLNGKGTLDSSGNLTITGALSGNCTAKNGDKNAAIVTHGTSGAYVARVGSNSTQISVLGQWGTTGDTYSWRYITAPSSDVRLKMNIHDCTLAALPVINAMRIREFDWTNGRHQTIGVVADELEKIDSKLAVGGGYTEDGNMSVKSVDTFYLMGYLIKAVQELSAEVEKLKGANK